MDIEALQGWKKVKVLEHCPAVLKGFKMVFSLQGLPFVEPGFGGLCRQDGDEVHGVAFKMDLESMAKLDDKEADLLRRKEAGGLRLHVANHRGMASL